MTSSRLLQPSWSPIATGPALSAASSASTSAYGSPGLSVVWPCDRNTSLNALSPSARASALVCRNQTQFIPLSNR